MHKVEESTPTCLLAHCRINIIYNHIFLSFFINFFHINHFNIRLKKTLCETVFTTLVLNKFHMECHHYIPFYTDFSIYYQYETVLYSKADQNPIGYLHVATKTSSVAMPGAQDSLTPLQRRRTFYLLFLSIRLFKKKSCRMITHICWSH